jgi:hypothetical protein
MGETYINLFGMRVKNSDRGRDVKDLNIWDAVEKLSLLSQRIVAYRTPHSTCRIKNCSKIAGVL